MELANIMEEDFQSFAAFGAEFLAARIAIAVTRLAFGPAGQIKKLLKICKY